MGEARGGDELLPLLEAHSIEDYSDEFEDASYLCGCGFVARGSDLYDAGDTHRRHVADALLPLIREREAVAHRDGILKGRGTLRTVESAAFERGLQAADYAVCGDCATARAEGAAEVRARVEAVLDSPPLIVSGIERDLDRTPSGRGGTVRHDPATLGWGASGCPGDNLTGWMRELKAALADTDGGAR